MGRIFEALEREEREKRRNGAGSDVWVAPTPAPDEVVFDVGESAAPPPERYLEQYQELRTELLSRDPKGKPKVILFTGTEYGDGATTTLANFAAVLSGAGRRSVLLIDGDLHAPRLHAMVSAQRTARLDEALAGNGASGPPRIERGGLYLIAGRPLPGRSPADVFQSPGFDELLERSRGAYDYVLVDCPPVQRSSEYWDLWRKVDGVVLVVRSGQTRRHVALRAKRQIQAAGGRILGVVLNRRRYYIPGWLYRRL